MSLDTRGIYSQRLLPQSLEDRLLSWLSRASGVLLLACVAALWASLASWSIDDPSLTHATTSVPQNWLGPLGAILSDLLLQTLGFAAVIALIAPLVWGVALVRRDAEMLGHVTASRMTIGYFPLAVLAGSGALSALPVLAVWPLHHGFGGVVGDGVFKVVSNLFAIISDNRAGLAAGILLWAVAITLGARSIGSDVETIWATLKLVARSRSADPAIDTSDSDRTSDDLAAHSSDARTWNPFAAPADYEDHDQARRGAALPSLASRMPSRSPFSGDDWADRVPDLGGVRPMTGAQHASAGNHVPHEFDQPQFQPIASEPGIEATIPRGGSFDLFTDAASRAIAQRFAPVSSDVVAAAHSKPSEPKAAGKLAQKAAGLMGGNARRLSGPHSGPHSGPQWTRPSINLLRRPTPSKAGPEFTQTVMRGNARLLEDVLADFGVKGEVKDIKPGPVITLYELEPARGTKSSRVIGLADDMARSMSVASVRAAVVPGRNAIGLELPNVRRDPVLLREILESEAYKSSDATLPIALGKGIGGNPIVADLARMPHLLVAGTTGSGKSVGINAFILSLLYRHSPEDCRLLMIDPKMLELSVYNGIPHLLTPVVTDPHKAVGVLNWAVSEMDERYKRMSALSVRNIDVFNNRVRNAKKRGELLSRTVQTGFDQAGQAVFENQKMDVEPLPHIVIVVDEFADLMIVAGKEVEQAVQRLAQMARAAGIHLIMATQRPSVDIITGTIKANFPTRISFKVTSKIDSRTILNEQGAEQLLGQGDMLYSTGAGQIMRVHGPYVSDEEVEQIADALRRQGPPVYVDGIFDVANSETGVVGGRESSDGDLYDRAVAIVLRDRKASTSYLQRRLSIGYNRAADLIERMERDGLISAANNVGKRDILVAGFGAGSGSADAA